MLCENVEYITTQAAFLTNDYLKSLGRYELIKTVERLEAIEGAAVRVSMVTMASSFSAAVAGEIAGESKSMTHEYVEIDLTSSNDCYHLPDTARVTRAIRNVFGEDADRNTIAPRRGRDGIWKIETPNLEKYRNFTELIYEGATLGKVTIKSEKITVRPDGQVLRRIERSPHDLLITLQDADSHLLRHVSNEQIVEKIVDIGIGKIKKSVQRQFHRERGEYTGNKYFVLENVKPEDRSQIPDSFIFEIPSLGKLKMWLNHRYQLRKCGFCGEKHDAICKIREKVNQLVDEREKLRAGDGFKVKTYSDSTLRYANQGSLQGDIDAMSGATLGNILNAIGVDTDNKNVPNLVLVAGANDKRMNTSPAEFISSLKTIRQRVTNLLLQKENIAVVTPPKIHEQCSPEDMVRDEIFEEHVKEMSEVGVKVWRNPIEHYDEDWGTHPSMSQTAELLDYINQKVTEEFGTPYQLPSTCKEVLSLPNMYRNVTSLYKYGCSACGDKERNRWANICGECRNAALADDIKPLAEDFVRRVDAKLDSELPSLGSDSDDELRCEECEVTFQEIRDLRQHFKDEHADKEVKFKRGKSTQRKDEGGKGRRTKSTPTKSI